MLQICPILLVLLCPPNIDAASTERKAKCGKTTVRSMVPFEYVSHIDKHPRSIAIAAKGHFGAGNFATVSDAFTGNSEQLAKNKCVAVKFMDSYFGHSLAVIDRMMALPPGQRGHLIEILDYGRSGDETVLLMERGEQSLHERIYTERRNYPDFESIRPLLEQVVRPLGEMHKVAMHLDVKPKNYVYADGALKLIDFDGAQLIPERVGLWPFSRPLAPTERANYAQSPEVNSSTDVYASPESETSKKVSAKADIWAVGVMIFETLLAQQSQNRLEKGATAEQIQEQIGGQLAAIASLFSGLDHEGNQWAFGDEAWLDWAVEPATRVSELWSANPMLAFLATNLLRTNPAERMTAIGILAFLEGNCLPEESDPQDMILFNKMSVQRLKMLAEAKLGEKGGTKAETRKWRKLHSLLEGLPGKRAQLLEGETRRREGKCDTVTL